MPLGLLSVKCLPSALARRQAASHEITEVIWRVPHPGKEKNKFVHQSHYCYCVILSLHQSKTVSELKLEVFSSRSCLSRELSSCRSRCSPRVPLGYDTTSVSISGSQAFRLNSKNHTTRTLLSVKRDDFVFARGRWRFPG